MKPFMKLFVILAVTAAGITAWSFLSRGSDNGEVSLEKLAPEHTKDSEKTAQLQTTTNSDSKIVALKKQASIRATEIANITGSNKDKSLTYEDNWCIASEDLLEDDEDYAASQLSEWQLSRGRAIARGGKLNELMDGLGHRTGEFPGVNDEYLIPYKEADRETLIRLGWDEDDKFALITIVKSPDIQMFDDQTKLEAAKRLVMLGDTAHGLNRLVIENMALANEAKRTKRGIPKKHVKQALAWVEFGMKRNDPGSLAVFMDFTNNFRDRLSGFNPDTELTHEDFADIEKMADQIYRDIDNARVDKGLPSFEDLEEPKVALTHYDKKVASFYLEYPSLMADGLFPASWKEKYFKKTPCVERHLARHDFLVSDLPAIKQQISALAKSEQ
ncbi:hypothetical protein [Alteromonas gracilis]|uniref:hypothetical protein n=1 Tax=Alteromonas gracilis TaxID=1479524 RepID=UPI003219D2D0